MADSGKVDPYGFERPPEFNYEVHEEFMARYLSVLARRAGRWHSLIGNKNSVSKSAKLKRYIRKGIPGEHRVMVWLTVSGAQEKMQKEPGLYQDLLQQQLDPITIENIEKDVPRTFPENIYFHDTPSDPNAKRRPLYNVLYAIALKHPDIGYCQGLNFICGLLLLIVKEEHAAFWLMDSLLATSLPEYYTKDMKGSKTDQEVLGELVKMKMPDVAAKIENQGLTWSIMTAKWFLCIYADVLPVETTLRIWDCLFMEGYKILFRVALTIIKHNRQKLLECKHMGEIMDVFKSVPNSAFVIHCHTFMQSIFKEPGSLSRSTIEKVRAQCLARDQ